MSNEKRTVLVVDDYEENRTAIANMLMKLEVRVVQADSGNAALETMRNERPALVLLDAEMPEMDGYQVINQMMSDSTVRHVPVILLTSNLSDRKQSLHKPLLEIIDYLTKPINEEVLLPKVKTFLELDRYRDAIKTLHDDNEKLLEAMHEGILGIDRQGLIKFANSAAIRMLRASPIQLVDTYVEALFEEPNHKAESDWEEHPVRKVCDEGNILQVEKSEFWRADGSAMKVKFAAVPVNDLDGMNIVLAFKQLTQERDSKDKLSQLSNMDTLTGLPARGRFEEVAEEALKRSKRLDGKLALLFIDLDHFKNINESLGHDIGDELIKGVADRLKKCIRRSDTVARLGGDEFGIVLEGLDMAQGAGVAAQNIIDQLQEPFLLDGHEIFTGCSIGIATYPNCGDTIRTLLKNADSAAYRAKSLGRNSYQFFNADLNKFIIDRMELENDLHHAVARQELSLDYLPVVNMLNNSVNGFEVNLKWNHPRRGQLHAEEFFSIAEDSGLIVGISEWMIENACMQVNQVFSEGFAGKDFMLCLNISPTHIIQENFASWLYGKMQQYGLSGKNILIEVGESVIMSRQQSCIEVLTDLHSMDVKLAIANFGTGYASMNLLRAIPLDVIKIGHGFIDNILENKTDQAIVKNLCNMALDMGLQLWVEGVASQAQKDLLQGYKIGWAQGTFFSDSISPSCFLEALESGPMGLRSS